MRQLRVVTHDKGEFEEQECQGAAMIDSRLHGRVRRLHLVARRAVEDWLGGAYRSVFKGVGVAFEEVREYQPGDDVRAIDWNVTARAGSPFVKRFIEERELTVMLALDAGAGMAFYSGERSKAAAAAEALAAVALAALRNNDRVGLLVMHPERTKIVPPRKGPRHALRLIRDLLASADSVDLAGVSPTPDGLRSLHRILHRRALVILASDFWSPGYENGLRLLSARHDVVGLIVHDPWERALPDVGRLLVRDPVTQREMFIDTGDARVRNAYQERTGVHAKEIVQTLRRAGADAIELSTAADSVSALRRFFDYRGRNQR